MLQCEPENKVGMNRHNVIDSSNEMVRTSDSLHILTSWIILCSNAIASVATLSQLLNRRSKDSRSGFSATPQFLNDLKPYNYFGHTLADEVVREYCL